MMSALALALQLLEALPGIANLTVEVENLVSSTVASIRSMQAENRDPTPAEWDALNAQIDAQRAMLAAS